MNKKLKLVLAVSLISVMIVLSSVVSLFFLKPDIYYAQSIASYKREGDQWFTVYVGGERANDTFIILDYRNKGFLDGSFSLILTFANATFSTKTSQPYQQISNAVVKFSYTLHKDESQSTDVYFTIEENVTGFSIRLDFESSQIFIHSTRNNRQELFNYIWEPSENAFWPITVG